jgi:predicted membrane channel-forming protein YqfA (hemolysin III family)
MPRRTRKLIGTLAMFAFVLVYAPIAMALAESRIVDAPKPVQTIAYLVLGLAWILPLMPLIRWMERSGGDRA